MHPSIRREEICPSFFLLYWSLQKIGEGGSLHWVYRIKCYSAPEMPSQIHPEIMTEQLCEPLLGQSSGHTKLTITVINSTNYSCSWILHLSTKNIPSGQGLSHLSNGVLRRHQALFNVLRNKKGGVVWIKYLLCSLQINSSSFPQFSSLQLLSHVHFFATPWTEVHQASLSFTISWSLLKLMSIESVMPSNHLILCCPFSSCLQSFPASGSFPVSQFFTSGGQSIVAWASASVLPMSI